jgi:hypothetical protein
MSKDREDGGGKLAFLAGICPQFWSHVPMMIQDVLNLQLIDGIHCLDLQRKRRRIDNSEALDARQDEHDDTEQSLYSRYAPISKCMLVGIIVYADTRRDGSMVYVLDDGTGLMDCVHWSTSDQQHDIYHLPNLFGDDDSQHEWVKERFDVGDSVRVYGKIECLARLNPKDTINWDRGHGKRYFLIGEIQAAIIEPLEEDVLLAEVRHWKRCNADAPHSIQHWLDLLGPQMQAQIQQRVNLPSADDSLGQWRVFGPSCRCKLSYMDTLLYCHCQATLEPLDPSLTFRDALLEHLVLVQSQHAEMLVFPYKSVKTNVQLRNTAFAEAKKAGKANEGIVDQLFRNTFRALRKDGIVYLEDSHTDEYLLITRDKVLEPFIRNQMEQLQQEDNKDGTKKQRRNFVSMKWAPPYLSKSTHMERLRYMHRCCLHVQDVASTNNNKI